MRDTSGNDMAAFTAEFAAGERAFWAGVRCDNDVSVSFSAGWHGAALEASKALAAFGPLIKDGPAILSALEQADFALRNFASAKLNPAAQKTLTETRGAVARALRLLPAPPVKIASVPPRVPANAIGRGTARSS